MSEIEQQNHGETSGTPIRRWLLPVGAGMLAGIVVAGLIVWTLMPKMMITRHESRYGVEETCKRLREAINATEGWTCPAVRDLNKSMAKQGVAFGPKVRLVELCNANYAKSVLQSDRHVATLMPCAFAVYEDNDGTVWVSGMNTSLMGTMMGGNIAEVMGNSVAADETKILSSVLK